MKKKKRKKMMMMMMMRGHFSNSLTMMKIDLMILTKMRLFLHFLAICDELDDGEPDYGCNFKTT